VATIHDLGCTSRHRAVMPTGIMQCNMSTAFLGLGTPDPAYFFFLRFFFLLSEKIKVGGYE
jgi:hypothetical protein